MIDLYPYRIGDQGLEFLLFKRAPGKIYEGQWRMVGGKAEMGESYWQAARREFLEETQMAMRCFWTVPSVNQFYEYKTDTIYRIPVFGAEVAAHEEPVLNEEHTEYRWVCLEELGAWVNWPEQLRLMGLIHNLAQKGKILPEWIIEDHRGEG